MEKLKNNKGISLASVLVTVILMIIILTSIIYSNSRTNEIKKSMYINSDIEELTKKVEMYYLEKGTLPLLEVDSSNYNYKTTQNGKDVVYYRLKISLLDNLNLNNYEIIQDNEQINRTNGDQWYVINKQTHTIYFVKCIGGEIVPQTAAYSSQYSNIISEAESNGVFNTTGGSLNLGVAESITGGVTDSASDASGGFEIMGSGNTTGDRINPGETSANGNVYGGVFDYAGYTSGWTPGRKSDNLVLHYDGEYNTLSGNEIAHSSSTSTWSDLSGNGNNGKFVEGGYEHTISLSNAMGLLNESYKNFKYSNASLNDTRSSSNINCNYGKNYLQLQNNRYILNKTLESNITGSDEYTIEIVFYYDGTSTKNGLIGYGLYNKVTWPDSFSKLGLIYNSSKYKAITYGYTTKINSNYTIFSVSGNGNNNFTISRNTSMDGKANALKINDNKRNNIRL